MAEVFAEFERAMIVERVNAGLKRAKAQGKILGRPRVDQATEKAIFRELAKGTGINSSRNPRRCRNERPSPTRWSPQAQGRWRVNV